MPMSRGEFDALKKGDKVDLEWDDAIRGGNSGKFKVKSTSTSKKYGRKKVTLVNADNPNSRPLYLYKDIEGKDRPSLAVGDMAARLRSFKSNSKTKARGDKITEGYEPADPKIPANERLRYADMGGGTTVYDVTREDRATGDYQEIAFINREGTLSFSPKASSEEKQWVREKFSSGDFTKYYVGEEVRAKVDIEEANFMDDDKVWTHAKRSQKGYVEDVDSDGYPTVRFYNTNTATIVGKDEVSKTGKKLTTRTIKEVIVDEDDIRKAKEGYLDKSNTPVRNSMGPGKGWHGERMRHRDAALKRRRR